MRTRTRFVLVLLFIVLLSTGCQPIQAPVTDALNATAIATDVPATAVPLAVDATPTVAPAAPISGKYTVETGTIESAALAGNLVGDPTERKYVVLLPPGYAESTKHYPVVYVLHGFDESEFGLLSKVEWKADSLRASGDLRDMIYVFANGQTAFGGSYYLSSPTVGDTEGYLTQELVDKIDSTYRTLPDRVSRGITGCSMGGDGSLALALKYPEVFNTVAALSGLHHSLMDCTECVDWAVSQFEAAPESWREFPYAPWVVQLYMAFASVAAPNPDAPPFFLEMPFELVGDQPQVVDTVLEKIRQIDNAHLAAAYVNQPIRLANILINNIPNDEMIPLDLVLTFSQELADLGIDHEMMEATGAHCEQDWAPVLKWLDTHLVHEE